MNSLDVPGVMARNVSDLISAFNVLNGQDEFDSTSVQSDFKDETELNLSELRVGIPQEYYCEGMGQQVLEAWSRIIGNF